MRQHSKRLLLVVSLILVVVLVVPAAAQDGRNTAVLQGFNTAPRGSNGPTVAGDGVGPYLMGPVLYDQTANTNGYGGINLISTETTHVFALADDFTVPDGYVWTVDGLVMPGFWYFDDPTTVTDFDVTIYADSGAGPGAIVCTPTLDTYSVTLTEATAEFGGDPCELSGGLLGVGSALF